MHWSCSARDGDWQDSCFSRSTGDIGHRRAWKSIFFMYCCTHLHRRWFRNGSQSRFAASRYGICSISSNWYLRCWMSHHRRCSRRRRISYQLRWRAIHGALCAQCEGPCIKRCCESFNDNGNIRRKRCRREKRSYSS